MAKRERRIIVTQCRVVTSGTNKRGSDYTIYELEATREDHTPIPEDMKLRSFDDLPLNTPIDVTIEPYNSDKYGMSYTVKMKGGKAQTQQALQKQVNDLVTRVEELERRSSAMAERVYGSPPAAANATPGPPTPSPSRPTPSGGGIPGDDDIPF